MSVNQSKFNYFTISAAPTWTKWSFLLMLGGDCASFFVGTQYTIMQLFISYPFQCIAYCFFIFWLNNLYNILFCFGVAFLTAPLAKWLRRKQCPVTF